MKKFIIALVLLIGMGSFNNSAEAQSFSISINIGRQPAWGPVGYDYVNYYYLPDIDCYYDVDLSLFYYFDHGRWISAHYLPYAYRHYDLYGMYKVVLNMRDPWRYHYNHYRDYARYRGYHNQGVIRDSRDNRYYDSRRNKVAWFSRSKSQRDYRYDYKNYDYDRRDNYYNGNNSVRPNRDYNYGNNNSDRNRGNDYNYDNNRRNNNGQNYGNNNSNRSDRNTTNEKKYDNSRKDNNRSNYGSNNSRSDKSRESSRPSVKSNKSNNSNNKDTKSTRSSSESSKRLASSEKSRR